jgi:monofunctional biosynthetic peptidoglycan transglycosylase
MKRLFVAGSVVFLLAIAFLGFSILTVPDVTSLRKTNPTLTSLMEQRAEENHIAARPIRSWVPYNNISPNLRNAVLIAEDSAFFQHSGYDITEIKESVKRIGRKSDSRAERAPSRNNWPRIYISRHHVIRAKGARVFHRAGTRTKLVKQRIFEIYLNVIEWGDGIYGIEPASRRYFGKPASQLFPEEAAILAAMIPNPRRYTPDRNLKYLERRKAEILDRLVRWKYLAPDEYRAAVVRPVVFQTSRFSRSCSPAAAYPKPSKRRKPRTSRHLRQSLLT